MLSHSVRVPLEYSPLLPMVHAPQLLHDIIRASDKPLRTFVLWVFFYNPFVIFVRHHSPPDLHLATVEVNAIPIQAAYLRSSHAKPYGHNNRQFARITHRTVDKFHDFLHSKILLLPLHPLGQLYAGHVHPIVFQHRSQEPISVLYGLRGYFLCLVGNSALHVQARDCMYVSAHEARKPVLPHRLIASYRCRRQRSFSSLDIA